MTGSPLTHYAALTETLAAYQSDYRDALGHWRNLETKAQATVAVTGIFIAAALPVVRDLKAGTTLWIRVPLLLAALALVMAVVFAVLALRIRLVARPPSGKDLLGLVQDLFREPAASDMVLASRNFLRDRIRTWEAAVDERLRTNDHKATRLRSAQYSLLGAIAILCTITAGTIVHPPPIDTTLSSARGVTHAVQEIWMPTGCDNR